MPGSRIPQLTAVSGANTANDDDLVIFDTSANTTKRISRSQLATGLVGDLPYTPTGSISATTIPTAVDALAGRIRWGSGTPEGAVTASVGTLFLRTDGGANTTLYVKESGAGNTGWAAK
jgi:hypothetical protein